MPETIGGQHPKLDPLDRVALRALDRQAHKVGNRLTTVTGCGFGRDGHFYDTEFSSLGLDNAAPGTGQVVRVPAHSSSPITVVGGLNFPGGFAAGPDGSLYVSNWSILPGHAPAGAPTGSIVRIQLHSQHTKQGRVAATSARPGPDPLTAQVARVADSGRPSWWMWPTSPGECWLVTAAMPSWRGRSGVVRP